ncbi:MAG: inositol monophosphatase [bacterium]|jgi:myo-inositol-1(or 4)-monophosphatase
MTLSRKEIGIYLKFAVATARKAGEILLKKSRGKNEILFKGRVNLVTAADLASEKFIVKSIEKTFPGHSRLAEEVSSRDTGSKFNWIIDPLDGTTNYAHRFPFYCVSLALEYAGKVILGVIYDPERDELFSAAEGKGAYLNGKQVQVTSQSKLSRSLLATGFPYDIGTSSEDNIDNYARFAKSCRGIRRAGSAALDLAYVACGRFDGFWELKLSPWDTAAGILLVKEAGGKVTDFQGKRFQIRNRYIVASNGRIHRQMLQILNAG